jgi:peptide chain release factor 1
MIDKLQALAKRYQEIEALLGQPEVASDPAQTRKLAKERSDLQPIVEAHLQITAAKAELEDAQLLAQDEDQGVSEMAREEIPHLQATIERLEQVLYQALLPKDPNDDKNVIMEIRSGTGGEEAALFAGDLYRMYVRYAKVHDLKVEVMDASETEQGGFKEVVFEVAGRQAYRLLKHEGGVHRVQRVPVTESQGRIHTSAATVAVLPEAEETDLDVNPNDIRIDVFHSGGAGGQNVNKVATAIRVVHIPTGIMAVCQDERSQLKNKTKAMKVLLSRLLERELEQQAAETSAQRREQVRGGERSEKVRTYNFPQDRLTDHRVNMSVHGLDAILAGQGRLDDIIDALLQDEQTRRLQDDSR